MYRPDKIKRNIRTKEAVGPKDRVFSRVPTGPNMKLLQESPPKPVRSSLQSKVLQNHFFPFNDTVLDNEANYVKMKAVKQYRRNGIDERKAMLFSTALPYVHPLKFGTYAGIAPLPIIG